MTTPKVIRTKMRVTRQCVCGKEVNMGVYDSCPKCGTCLHCDSADDSCNYCGGFVETIQVPEVFNESA